MYLMLWALSTIFSPLAIVVAGAGIAVPVTIATGALAIRGLE
jgi:hypothetical protein